MTARKKINKKPTPSSEGTIFVLSVALVIAIGTFLFLSSRQKETIKVAEKKEVTVMLASENNSSETGTAFLKEADGKVVVTLAVENSPKGVTQPAHIHTGTCPNPGEVKYPLNSLVDGKSETTLNVSVNDLLSQMPLAVNVHKSVAKAKVSVSCGDIAK
ncbi:MAG: CHRD domain-containing protein [Candidatus Blackburnbacteria bacterium]|nr:CHRD domain-containing protein [Candidatus Blackburnbacteria bacterium]